MVIRNIFLSFYSIYKILNLYTPSIFSLRSGRVDGVISYESRDGRRASKRVSSDVKWAYFYICIIVTDSEKSTVSDLLAFKVYSARNRKTAAILDTVA